MVKIRLKRTGRKNRPCFRLVAADARFSRDGRTVEDLGAYDPWQKDEARKAVLRAERILHWLSRGAQPTDAAAAILRRCGIRKPAPVPVPAAPAKG